MMKLFSTVFVCVILFMNGCSNAEEVIETYQPLELELRCNDGYLNLVAFNKSDYDLTIENGVLGIDKSFQWNPYIVMERSNYDEAFSQGKNWLIDQYRIKPNLINNKEGNALTIRAGQQQTYRVDAFDGYNMKPDSEYVIFLNYLSYITKLNNKKIELAAFSNKVIVQGMYCSQE